MCGVREQRAVSYEPAEVIEVLAWGRRVGAVALNPATGWYPFAYAQEWVAGGIELAPLHMALREQPYEFPSSGARPSTGSRLSSPTRCPTGSATRSSMRGWPTRASQPATSRHLTVSPMRPTAPWGPRVPPAGARRLEQPPSAVQLADLVLAARLTVRGEFASDETAHAALQQLIQVGTSAGGARAKAVVAFNPQSFQVHSAYDDHEEGFEQWLIKLDGVSSTGMDGRGDDLGATAQYGRIEYAYSEMAKAAGIDMMPCQLLAEGPRRHFMTKRFDRGPDGERLHMLSLCGMADLDYNLRATHSYDQYFQCVVALDLDLNELAEAYRRMVFNIMAGNHDDHTKNFAFLRTAETGWRLSPAYDVTHAYNPSSQWIESPSHVGERQIRRHHDRGPSHRRRSQQRARVSPDRAFGPRRRCGVAQLRLPVPKSTARRRRSSPQTLSASTPRS